MKNNDNSFPKLLIMILSFMLVLMNIIFEVTNRITLTDFQILLIAMFVVSVLPALGGVIYKWMNAENEPEDRQYELRGKRTKVTLTIAIIFIVLLSIYDIKKYLL